MRGLRTASLRRLALSLGVFCLRLSVFLGVETELDRLLRCFLRVRCARDKICSKSALISRRNKSIKVLCFDYAFSEGASSLQISSFPRLALFGRVAEAVLSANSLA